MIHDKNSNIHQALANKFNRKKTVANDLNRINSFYQTNKMINQTIKVDVRKPKNEEFDTDNNDSHIDTIYSMEGNKPSTKLNLNLSNEDEIKMIPKIIQKDILIPKYSDNDKFDFSAYPKTHPNCTRNIIGYADDNKPNIHNAKVPAKFKEDFDLTYLMR